MRKRKRKRNNVCFAPDVNPHFQIRSGVTAYKFT